MTNYLLGFIVVLLGFIEVFLADIAQRVKAIHKELSNMLGSEPPLSQVVEQLRGIGNKIDYLNEAAGEIRSRVALVARTSRERELDAEAAQYGYRK